MVIGGKKFGYTAKGDAGEWFRWFIGVGDWSIVVGGHGGEGASWG